MTKDREKAIKLYWNIAKERCPFHEEEMVNSFLEGFIDCAEYLLLQNTDLEKENAELRAQIKSDEDLPAIAYQQGAERQKKILGIILAVIILDELIRLWIDYFIF